MGITQGWIEGECSVGDRGRAEGIEGEISFGIRILCKFEIEQEKIYGTRTVGSR